MGIPFFYGCYFRSILKRQRWNINNLTYVYVKNNHHHFQPLH